MVCFLSRLGCLNLRAELTFSDAVLLPIQISILLLLVTGGGGVGSKSRFGRRAYVR